MEPRNPKYGLLFAGRPQCERHMVRFPLHIAKHLPKIAVFNAAIIGLHHLVHIPEPILVGLLGVKPTLTIGYLVWTYRRNR